MMLVVDNFTYIRHLCRALTSSRHVVFPERNTTTSSGELQVADSDRIVVVEHKCWFDPIIRQQ
jgi:hypothetical protein